MDDSAINLRVDEDCDNTFTSIAHEVAHTWFHGSDAANWIDEGLANTIEYQVALAHQDGQEVVYPPVTYCSGYRNIRELERGTPERESSDSDSGFSCNYTLGNGIFGDLRALYGDGEFNARIAQLARRGSSAGWDKWNVADVRRVFGGDAHALEIIDRWYDGLPEMRRYRHLDAVTWTHPPTVDGDWLHFAGKTEQPELVQDFVLGDDPFCSQFALYSGVVDQEWVTNINDPLPAGWKHSEIPEVVTVNHDISPGTGEFSVTAKINDNALANISDLSLLVRSRVTVGADGRCSRGINYSQVPVTAGEIPGEFKAAKHYALDAVKWTSPPVMSGNTLRFTGKALPGAVGLTYSEEYCGQFEFYERDAAGYQYINSLNPLLPSNRHWTSQITGEVTSQRTDADGTFEAQVRLSPGALAGFSNPVLVVKTPPVLDSASNKCGESDVLSAVDIR